VTVTSVTVCCLHDDAVGVPLLGTVATVCVKGIVLARAYNGGVKTCTEVAVKERIGGGPVVPQMKGTGGGPDCKVCPSAQQKDTAAKHVRLSGVREEVGGGQKR